MIIKSLVPTIVKTLALVKTLVTVSALSLCAVSPAAAEFPDKKLEIMVYMKPGGLIDVTARKIAKIIQDKYSEVPVIVTNKPGAGGVVAVSQLLRKKADGYTILAMTNSVISKHLQSKKEEQLSELDYVARIASDYECLIAHKDSPEADFSTLLQQAKEKSGSQLWVGPAAGGTDHLFAQQVWENANISGRWVPYPSGAQAIASLLGKHASVYVGNPSDVKGRPDLTVVAVAAPERLPDFPDVPTFAELGYEELTGAMLWRGFALKKGVPAEARNFWERTLEQVSNDPEWDSFVKANSMNPAFDTKDQFVQLVDKQIENDQRFFKKG